ncbi:MAG: 5-oxoprolinase subunit PxpA [bacterium]|nr:5-oxoprolinase subunit PxpA [bacterium]
MPAEGAAVDLNSDSGESFSNWTMGDDATMMTIVSSANIACGFHASDPRVMRETLEAAAANGVSVGAHVAYRDLANFGRVFVDVPPAELRDAVIYQMGALRGMAQVAGTDVRYVKPHGALYNTIVHHEEQAQAVVDAIVAFDSGLALLCLPGSAVERLAREAGLRTVREAFADRAYTAEGTLVSRRIEGSVIHDAELVSQRMVQLATQGTVTTIDGEAIPMEAESICVHGDTAGAVEIARKVRDALVGAGVEISPFA